MSTWMVRKRLADRTTAILAVASFGLGAAAFSQGGTDYQVLLTMPETPTIKPLTNASVVASTTSPGYSAASIIDNSGMSGVRYPQDHHGTDGSAMWLSAANDISKTIHIDLGDVFPLGLMQAWNFNENSNGVDYSGRGVRDCYIQYSANGMDWTTLEGQGALDGLFELARATSGNEPTAATNQVSGPNAPIDFSGAPARYIRILIARNWGGAPGDGDDHYYGLSEVRIYRQGSRVQAAGDPIAGARVLAWSSADESAHLITSNLGMSNGADGVITAEATVGVSTGWLTEVGDPSPHVLFDLGGAYPLDRMVVWNANSTEGESTVEHGLKNVTIYHSLSNHGHNPDSALGPFHGWTKLSGPNEDETWTFAKATGAPAQAATSQFMFDDRRARYVMIVPAPGAGIGNWGGPGRDARYGLSQVRFFAGRGIVAEPAAHWDGLFGQRAEVGTERIWSGADGSYSTPYIGPGGAEHSLFTFSDTYKDNWHPTTHRRTMALFPHHNSSAVYSGGAKLKPSLADIALDAENELKPDAATYGKSYYWLNGGVYLADPPRIYLLGIRAGESRGINLIELPLLDGVIQWDSQRQYDTGFHHNERETRRQWSLVSDIMDRTAIDGYLYAYGYYREPEESVFGAALYTIVGRVTPENITEFDRWTWWDGSAWSESFTDAAPITDENAGLTCNVTPAWEPERAGQYVMTKMTRTIGPVSVAYADTPWGPFGEWTSLYAPPENNPDLFDDGVWWYTGKHHPDLSLPGEALMSYAVNAGNRLSNLDSADIYRPRFVRVRTID